jgi:seryl-tRNA synthetase
MNTLVPHTEATQMRSLVPKDYASEYEKRLQEQTERQQKEHAQQQQLQQQHQQTPEYQKQQQQAQQALQHMQQQQQQYEREQQELLEQLPVEEPLFVPTPEQARQYQEYQVMYTLIQHVAKAFILLFFSFCPFGLFFFFPSPPNKLYLNESQSLNM